MAENFYVRWPSQSTGGGGSGTVTSVGLADGSSTPIYTISGSPVTTSGTLTFTLATKAANIVFAGPASGSAAQPTFRSLVSTDISTLFGNLTDVGTDGITIGNGSGSVLGAGTTISQHVADTTHNGYLSSTDWNTFNGKQASGNYITALTGDGTASGPGSAALTLATVNSNVGSFTLSSITVNGKGLVTAAASGTTGNLTEATSSVLTITGGTNAVIGSGASIQVKLASTSQGGYLSSTDWNTFNGKQGAFSGLTTDGVIYATSATAIASTAAGTNKYPLVSQGGSGSAPQFAQLDLTAGVTGVLPIANGGTNNGSLLVTAGGVIYTDGTKLVNVGAGSSGNFLKSNAGSAPSWANPTISLTAPLVTNYTSSSGTHTFTGSPLYVKVVMCGGGAGGTGSGTGGAPGAGTVGGNTSFGTSLIVANGGAVGAWQGSGGLGGTASLGTGPTGVAVSGGYGSGSDGGVMGERTSGGSGGMTPYFCGGGAATDFSGAGVQGVANTGGGGQGGGNNAANFGIAGAGGGSGGFVEALISGATLSGLSGSAAYVVGAGGSGGTAGTSGFVGGAGAAGQIIVTEYYQ